MELTGTGVRSALRLMGAAALGIVFLGLAGGCNRGNKYQPPPPLLVKVVKPIQKNVPDYVMYTGNTKGFQTVEMKARVTGYLTKIGFRDGSFVKKGTVLFVIDQRPFQADLDGAQAKLKAAIADEVKTKSEYVRNAALYKKDAASKADVDVTLGNWEVAKANIDLAKANLETAQINFDFSTIVAPFDGVVSRHYLDVGNVVNADMTKLTDIIQYDPMYAYFNISEADSLRFLKNRIQKGEKREYKKDDYPIELGLQNETGYPHKGWVDFVNNEINTGTGTMQVRGVFPNPPVGKQATNADLLYALPPGAFVRVRGEVGMFENALLVPDTALGTDQRGPYLFVVVDKDGDKVIESRSVTLGPLVDGSLRVVLTNLKLEDTVVSEGLLRIRAGDKVTIEPDQRPPDAAAKKK